MVDQQLDERTACKEYVTLLKLAADHGEQEVSKHIEQIIGANALPLVSEIEKRMDLKKPKQEAQVTVHHSNLASYNALLHTGENI